MKIGIFLDNNGVEGIDLSRPDLGNPGIGGTEYCFSVLIYSLKKYCSQYDVLVYLTKPTKLPMNSNFVVANNVIDAVKRSRLDKCDFIIIRNQARKEIYEGLKNVNQKIIIWGHNFYLSEEAKLISNNDKIILNVFVGREQYDRYIDHDISSKSTYIYNMVPESGCAQRFNDSKTVVYIGSLVEAKGFHILASQWKKIVEKYPKARLRVMGSGDLYDRSNELGKFGISNSDYEGKFIRYLTNKNGKLLDSVEFIGIVGRNKEKILSRASVGVVNPSGKTETFGLGAIEMNQHFLPVVTVKKFGFLDTVINKKTGLTFFRSKNVYKGILRLLKNKKLNEELGFKGKIRAKIFVPEILIKEWMEVFLLLSSGQKIFYKAPTNNYFSNFKFLRIFVRFLRFNLKMKFIPAVVDVETFFWKLFKILKNKKKFFYE